MVEAEVVETEMAETEVVETEVVETEVAAEMEVAETEVVPGEAVQTRIKGLCIRTKHPSSIRVRRFLVSNYNENTTKLISLSK